MFLNLMVAQLRYQDPMNPTDSGQFLAQTAQFTALEKMQDVADQTAALLSRPDLLRRDRHGRQERDLPRLGRHDPVRRRRLGDVRRHRPDARRRRQERQPRPDQSVSAASATTDHSGTTPTTADADPVGPPDHTHTHQETHHASLALRRHQRPARQPDHARRDRQQHRQRQHRRLQVQLDRLPGHAVPDAHRRHRLRARGRRGGTNPIQVGLGVQVAATNTNFNQGSTQTTGRPTDLMIQGDGMFVVQTGNEQTYTRAGAFTFDETDTLVTPRRRPRAGLPLDATGRPSPAPPPAAWSTSPSTPAPWPARRSSGRRAARRTTSAATAS